MERKSNPDAVAKHDGWQTHMAKKASKAKRERYNGSLFCKCYQRGALHTWTPYNPPPSREEVTRRLYPEETHD